MTASAKELKRYEQFIQGTIEKCKSSRQDITIKFRHQGRLDPQPVREAATFE